MIAYTVGRDGFRRVLYSPSNERSTKQNARQDLAVRITRRAARWRPTAPPQDDGLRHTARDERDAGMSLGRERTLGKSFAFLALRCAAVRDSQMIATER